MSVNNATVSGNIGQEPVLRTTSSGTSVLTFSVAVNERVKGSMGEYEQRTSWIPVIVFGERAAGLRQHLHSGTKVTVSGHLREDRWTAQDGQARSKIQMVLDEIDWAEPRRSQGYGGER